MVLPKQIEALLDYLEGHRELALGHYNRSKEGRELSRRQWSEVAQLINALSTDSQAKTGDEWRLYYNEYKYKCLKKIKAQKQDQDATGGGPGKNITLTPLQDRLYDILGRDVGEPLPGIRLMPLLHEETAEVLLSQAIIEVPRSPQPQSPIISYPAEPYHPPPQPSPPQQLPSTQHPVLSPEQLRASPPQRHAFAYSEPRANQRRRQRQPRRQRAQDADVVQLQLSQERLERSERAHTDAIVAQARATDRLAAAIEQLHETILGRSIP